MSEQKLTGYPSIDKPWLKYYDCDFDEKDIPEMSMYQLAERENANNLDSIALDIRGSANHFEKGITITYRELFSRIKMSAKASKHLGIQANEIVPIILPNVPEARVLIYSNSMIGATSYPITPMLPANQLESIVNENEIKNIFMFEAFYAKYADALSHTKIEHIVMMDGSESLPKSVRILKKIQNRFGQFHQETSKQDDRIVMWDDYVARSKCIKKEIIPYYCENHIAAIIGTSGTTGIPKGVCLTDRNINAAGWSDKVGKAFEGSFMDALLPSIGYGISMIHFQTITGKYVYLIPELLTTKFPEALEKLQPDNFPGGPVHYLNLRNSELYRSGKIPTGKNFISGGASLPKNVEQELNQITEDYDENGAYNEKLVVRQGYGLSENVASGAFCKRGAYRFGSIGVPFPYITISVFVPGTDEELSYNEKGEICIKGPTVMHGYLNRPDETEKVIKVHRDGERWIHTQDIGYMDESGHIFHVDRTKNIFMRTGFNVHPSKIAEFINTLPLVNTSTVIGFAHPKEQCVPVAFVVLNEEKAKGRTDEEIKEELMHSCYENLEETSIPYDFVIVNMLPINVGGKIDVLRIQKESGIDLMKKDEKVTSRLLFQ